MPINVPAEVEAVWREFRVCEFSTLARDGTAITWSTAARYLPDQTQFLITTSIELPQKPSISAATPRWRCCFRTPPAVGWPRRPSCWCRARPQPNGQLNNMCEHQENNLFRPT